MTRSRVSKQNYSHAELTNVPNLGRRNMIINGSMQVAQRGTSSTGTSGYHTVDRWRIQNGGVGNITTTQESTNGVAGVSKYSHKFAATNTATLASSTDGWIRYVVETKDMENHSFADSTRNFTLSFYVKCSNAGQSSACITSGDFGTAQYVAPFTIAAADTWQRVTITFPGNSALSSVSGDYGLRLYWNTGAGSQYTTSSTNQWISTGDYGAVGDLQICGVNGRYIQFTGVQLEAGNVATTFENRSIAEELALCQRYLHTVRSGIVGFCSSSNGTAYWTVDMKPKMRTTPTVTCTTNSYRYGDVVSIGVTMTSITVVTNGYSSADAPIWYVTGTNSHSPAQYRNQLLEPQNATHGTFLIDAEL